MDLFHKLSHARTHTQEMHPLQELEICLNHIPLECNVRPRGFHREMLGVFARLRNCADFPAVCRSKLTVLEQLLFMDHLSFSLLLGVLLETSRYFQSVYSRNEQRRRRRYEFDGNKENTREN